MKDELDVEAELIRGDRGIFDVEVDGDVIFSKHMEDRFPTNEEIVGKLRG